MSFSNVVATVPGVLMPSVVAAFIYEYVRTNNEFDYSRHTWELIRPTVIIIYP